MLELPILGLLKEQPMHGYQLSKELTDVLGGFWRVSYGSLYPSLKRLQKQGAVEADEARVGGRRKNVYRITSEGERVFDTLLQEGGRESAEDTTFRMRLAFFRYLKPESRIRLLERRRAFLIERLDTIKARLATASPNADSYTLSLMTHGQNVTAGDIAWLDDLIAAERRQVTATGPAAATSATAKPSRARSRTARRTASTARKNRRTTTTRRKERTT
ncbi:MAG: PadR family transcriptional regulator [Actinomycetota bacterium]